MAGDDLRKAGLKVTMPRLKILKVLEDAQHRHMSAEDVHKALAHEVSLPTVYRVLTQFEAAGLLRRHNFEEGRAVYEVDEGEHHDHIVCVKCGVVEEFVDEVIEQRQAQIAAEKKVTMTDHSLTIYGICQDCQAV